jgi:transcriptional regulator
MASPRNPPSSQERSSTVRSAIAAALREHELTARELSALLSVQEREVASHLEHIEHSLRHSGERLCVKPPRCLACGFAFEQRERRSKPSRCPSCRSERIEPAHFKIDSH